MDKKICCKHTESAWPYSKVSGKQMPAKELLLLLTGRHATGTQEIQWSWSHVVQTIASQGSKCFQEVPKAVLDCEHSRVHTQAV
jgi:hypothetical protein